MKQWYVLQAIFIDYKPLLQCSDDNGMTGHTCIPLQHFDGDFVHAVLGVPRGFTRHGYSFWCLYPQNPFSLSGNKYKRHHLRKWLAIFILVSIFLPMTSRCDCWGCRSGYFRFMLDRQHEPKGDGKCCKYSKKLQPTARTERTRYMLQIFQMTMFNWHINTNHDLHTLHLCTDQESK